MNNHKRRIAALEVVAAFASQGLTSSADVRRRVADRLDGLASRLALGGEGPLASADQVLNAIRALLAGRRHA